MSASEVHPLGVMSRAALEKQRGQQPPPPAFSQSSSLVLYSLVGEELEQVEPDKPHVPDTHWNAFVLPQGDHSGVRLGDIQHAFPLGSSYHFAFRNETGAYVDLTNPNAFVPRWEQKIVLKVTPLAEAPQVEYVSRPEPVREQYTEDRPYNSDEYEEFRTSDYEPDNDSPVEEPSRVDHRESGQWNSTYTNNASSSASRGSGMSRSEERERERYSESRPSVTSDAQAYLRKQTEQAYDFAKKISMEDAKKGASETAKKAKKWGGSLLSSISASISNAASVVKNETIQVGGISVTVVRPLAEGAYAQVLLVRSTQSGETFALKRVICQSQEVADDVQTELQVFRSVKHLNVMPLVEFGEAQQQQHLEYYFLFPYFERGSLWDAIEVACNSSSPLWPFTQRVALHLFHGICSGVLALHRGGFCHRDLKPHNILLSSSSAGEDFLAFLPVVTDFGSCSPLRVEVRTRRASMDLQDDANRKSSAPYRAPELHEPTLDGAYDGQSDVWSLGCLLYAMAFGTNPFEHPREGFMKLACMNGRVTFPPEQKGGIVCHRNAQFSHEFCDFIRDMLHTNPEERPSVLDALEFTEELLHDEMSR